MSLSHKWANNVGALVDLSNLLFRLLAFLFYLEYGHAMRLSVQSCTNVLGWKDQSKINNRNHYSVLTEILK